MDGRRGSKKTLPEGITHKLSHQAQQTNENEEVAEQLIAEARAKGKAIYPNDISKKIRQEKKEEKRKKDAELIGAGKFPIVEGKFKTIVVDPPWNYEKDAKGVNLTEKEQGKRTDTTSGQNVPKLEEIAKKHGVSSRTIKRDAKFAEAVDKLPPEEKGDIKSPLSFWCYSRDS